MTTRVFQIDYDSDRFQCLFVDSPDEALQISVHLDGTPRRQEWSPPPVYAEFPRLEKPDIWNLYEASSFALSHRAASGLRDLLLEAELLPLPVGDETLMLVNVVEVRNYLDTDRTRWFPDMEGLLAEVPEFAVHRIGGPSLFKLPHDDAWLYCWEDDEVLDESFRHAVVSQGLTGLTFEEIWNSETGGRRSSSVPEI